MHAIDLSRGATTMLDITRRTVLALIAGLTVPAPAALAKGAGVLVHRDPNCGCCLGWVDHLKAAGFVVSVEETDDLPGVRRRLGVPPDLAACHTAKVQGYVLEGHVPAAAVQRLLRDRPDAAGLAVPGMPAGSPGMDGTPEPYAVVLFGKGERTTYMRFVGSDVAG
jgi:hypothetical protein